MRAHLKVNKKERVLDLDFELEELPKIPNGLEGIVLVEDAKTGEKTIRKIRYIVGETDGRYVHFKEPRARTHKYIVTFSQQGYKMLKGNGYTGSKTGRFIDVQARCLKIKQSKWNITTRLQKAIMNSTKKNN